MKQKICHDIFSTVNIYRLGKIFMKIAKISYGQNFCGNENNNRKSFLDNLQTHVKNSADMTDTIVVSRTIFKGYLGIMTGTTLVTLAGLINKAKHPKVFKGVMGAGLITSLYGTWAFVRPFVLKDAKGVAKTK